HALGQDAAARVEDRAAHRAQLDRALLLPLRARHIVVVSHELHLHQARGDDHRPRGHEGEELEEALLREGHQRGSGLAGGGWRLAVGLCELPTANCELVSTITIARGSVFSNPSAAARLSTAPSAVRRSISRWSALLVFSRSFFCCCSRVAS